MLGSKARRLSAAPMLGHTMALRALTIAAISARLLAAISGGHCSLEASAHARVPSGKESGRHGVSQKATLFPAAFFSQLRPIVEPFPDLALKAALGRIIEGLTAQRLREIVPAGKGVRRVMIVFIARAIALLLHQPGRRIQDVFWRQQRARLLGRALGSAERGIDGIRLGRGRDIES